MDDTKRRRLTEIYARMPTREIERRLARGGLVPEARQVAADMLKARRESGKPGPAPVDLEDEAFEQKKVRSARGAVLLFVVLLALASGLGYLFLDAYLFALIFGFIVLPALAGLLGKAFPRAMRIIGWLAVASPVGLWGYAWSQGALSWKAVSYSPVGPLITYVGLFILSAFGMAIGAGLLAGASHSGSWLGFIDQLKARQEAAFDKLDRRG